MNVEIRAEAALFQEKEYISGILRARYHYSWNIEVVSNCWKL